MKTKELKTAHLLLVLFLITNTLSFSQNPNQKYNNTLWNANLAGGTQFFFKLETKGNKFSFTSRKGSTKDIIGTKYYIARLIGKVKPSAVTIKGKCYTQNDTLYLNGTYISLSSTQDFNGWIYQNNLNVKMSKNSMQGKLTNNYSPQKNYSALLDSALENTYTYIYNPSVLKEKEWRKFETKINKLKHCIVDDYEFRMTYNYNVQKLTFTHYGISQIKPETNNSSEAIKDEKQKVKFRIDCLNKNSVLFTAKSFSASADEIKPYIDSLKSMNFENLIIDLRNNSGGSISSALPLAQYIVTDTLYGGIFLTQQYFKSHTEVPSLNIQKSFPLFSEASCDLILDGIHNQEGLCLIVYPDADHFKGKVYILTNNNTASTCEPFVYGLQLNKRAVIVGEQTAGAMMNAEAFKLSNNYKLWLPTADYYTVDGIRIDQIGVTPNIKTKPKNALNKVMEILRK